jgi:hypothetical protein
VIHAEALGSLERESLQALPAIVVAVECAPELEKEGLRCGQVRQDALEKLRAAGVPLREEPVKPDPRNRPAFLTLRLATAVFAGSHTFQLYAVTLQAQLVQDAQLPRFQDKIFPAATWGVTKTLMVGPTRVAELRQDAVALIDQFIDDQKRGRPARR